MDDFFEKLNDLLVLKNFKNIVDFYVEKGVDINIEIPGINSNLICYCIIVSNDIEDLEYIYQNGGNLNSLNCFGLDITSLAIINRKKEFFDFILKNLENTSLLSENKTKNALMYAVETNEIYFVSELLNKIDPNSKDLNGNNSLWYLKSSDEDFEYSESIFEILISNGCDIYSENYDGENVLFHFIREGSVKFVEKLSKHKVLVKSFDNNRNSTLLLACRKQNLKIIEILLKNGASVNAKNNDCYYPIYFALVFENIKMIEILLEHNASLNVYTSNEVNVLNFYKKTNYKVFEVLNNYKDKMNEDTKKIFISKSFENLLNSKRK